MARKYNVWTYDNGTKRKLGVVTGDNQTQAERKAQTLYRLHSVWVTDTLSIA
jgi:hypothetical protein